MFKEYFVALWTLLDIVHIKCVLFISIHNLGDIMLQLHQSTYKP